MAILSEVEICNLALDHIRKPHIQSLTETSQEATICNSAYEVVRDGLLIKYDWGFSRIVATLTKHTEDPPGDWGFRYQYPEDCLYPLTIVLSTLSRTAEPIAFTTELLDDGSEETILSDTDEAQLRYVKRITNPGLFKDYFTVALTWAITEAIAMPLTGSTDVWRYARSQAVLSINAAITKEGKTGYPGPTPDPQSFVARG